MSYERNDCLLMIILRFRPSTTFCFSRSLSLSLSLSLQTVPISSVAVRRRSEEAHLVFCGGRGRERAAGRTRGRTDHAIVAIVARVWITRHKIAPSLRAGLLVF